VFTDHQPIVQTFSASALFQIVGLSLYCFPLQ
jgi:hypothetical protein